MDLPEVKKRYRILTGFTGAQSGGFGIQDLKKAVTPKQLTEEEKKLKADNQAKKEADAKAKKDQKAADSEVKDVIDAVRAFSEKVSKCKISLRELKTGFSHDFPKRLVEYQSRTGSLPDVTPLELLKLEKEEGEKADEVLGLVGDLKITSSKIMKLAPSLPEPSRLVLQPPEEKVVNNLNELSRVGKDAHSVKSSLEKLMKTQQATVDTVKGDLAALKDEHANFINNTVVTKSLLGKSKKKLTTTAGVNEIQSKTGTLKEELDSLEKEYTDKVAEVTATSDKLGKLKIDASAAASAPASAVSDIPTTELMGSDSSSEAA